MKHLLLVMLFFITLASHGQSVIYQQNFDGNNGSFTNTIVSQTTAVNGWLANNTAAQYVAGANAYRHLWNWSAVANTLNPHASPISGRSLGMGFYNVNAPNVANQFFRTWDGTNCSIMPVTTRWAHVGFSTVGYTNIKVEFKWKCSGEVDAGVVYDYGTVNTSVDGGANWLMDQTGGQAGTTGAHGAFVGGLYYNATTTQTATLTLPSSRDNKPNFRIAFRMVVDECYGTGGGFIIDDIVVTGDCATSITSVTGGERCGTGTVGLSAVGAAGGGGAITQYRWYTAATGGTPAATTATGSWTTPSLSETTTYYVAAYNGRCETDTRTAVTATINQAPADPVIVQASFPIGADECSAEYIKLDLGSTAATLNTWLPVTGLYTDAALTQPYTSGTNASTVYALSDGTQEYTVTTSNGGAALCTKTANTTVTMHGKRFIGTTGDWFVAGNWNPAGVPDTSNCIIIPAGMDVLIEDADAFAASVTLQGDAVLTVNTGSTLMADNAVVVSPTASLTVHTNAALLQAAGATANTNTGNVNIHRDSSELFRLDYTMWASPVSGQNLYGFSEGTLTNRFYTYDGLTGNYVNINPEETDFEPATGYLIRMPNGSDVPGYIDGDAPMVFNGIFTGVPNNGDVTVPLTAAGDRYTAIGNPYPSPINVMDFFEGGNDLLDDASPIYFWRKTNDSEAPSYATLTTTGYAENSAPGGGSELAEFYTEGNEGNWMLAPGQGFIVRTAQNATQPAYTFTNTMRRAAPAGGTAFFRTLQSPMSRFWLDLTDNNDSLSQALVVYKNGATTGLDYSMDGRHYPSGSVALYSFAEDTNLTIQTRPAFDAEDVVPVGYVAITAGEHTISLRRTDGVFGGAQDIFLKDNLTGVTHDIKESAYTFTTEAGTFNSRFEVVYAMPPAMGTKTPNDITSSVVVYNSNSLINVSSPNALISDVTVFDVRGRELFKQTNVNAHTTALTGFSAEQQVLIINVTTDKGKVSKKIVY